MRERTRAVRVNMKSSVAKHYGYKRARHCGLIANGRSQANEADFFLYEKHELLLRSLHSLRSNYLLGQWRQLKSASNRTTRGLESLFSAEAHWTQPWLRREPPWLSSLLSLLLLFAFPTRPGGLRHSSVSLPLPPPNPHPSGLPKWTITKAAGEFE